MRSTKWLLAALILTPLVACSGLSTTSGPANQAEEPEFGDFGYDNVYRYYGGPSAVSQQTKIQQQQDRAATAQRR